MQMMTRWLIALLVAVTATHAWGQAPEAGFSLTEIGTDLYDAAPTGQPKTSAQLIVDRLRDIGVTHINLSPRGVMTDPRGNEIVPRIIWDNRGNPSEIRNERRRYLRLIKYIKSLGMTVGMRPIFFVIDENGNTPVIERMPDGTNKVWWHGNIQPQDPNQWFESFKTFLSRYLTIAKVGRVEEFTVGAELYSMTVGIEDQWEEHPHGFPAAWLEILQHAKSQLPASTRIMYDINFTDDTISADGITESGGELARWKYRLVDLADENNENWRNLRDFWVGLDAIGIDMYRSLASDSAFIPEFYGELVSLLQQTTERYASQLDNALFEIEYAVDSPQVVIFKEIGYRSVTKGFIRPFEYAGGGELNIMHQAAAYEAFFNTFWLGGWEWFKGATFWDASVSQDLHGPMDTGFSPLGKEETEDLFKRILLP